MNKPFLNMSGQPSTPDGKDLKDALAPGARKAAPAHPASPQATPAHAPHSASPGPQGTAARPVPPAAAERKASAAPAAPAVGNASSSHWLMIGVFALSAMLGGGLAGLYLALQDTGEPAAGSAAAGAPSAISVITPQKVATREEGHNPSPEAASPANPPAAATKDQERLASDTMQPSAAASPAPREAATTPGADELKQLTEQVVGALGALGRAERQGTVEETASGAEQLRDSLASLVDAALASGKSDEEIRKLVAEALGRAGEENIPALLRNASGKVDIARLLASIMPSAASAADVPMNPEERAYFDQLAAEAGQTTTAERSTARQPRKAAAPAASRPKARPTPRANGRFFVRNGKRYTIVRKGDTLSDIAFAAYGDVLAYSAILRANRGHISTRRLQPGTRILIPDVNTVRKTRKRRVRRQSAAPAPVSRRAATARKRATQAPRRAAARATSTSPAKGSATSAVKKILTLPAGGQPAVDPKKPVVKYTNFRSPRDAQPVPLAPQQQK